MFGFLVFRTSESHHVTGITESHNNSLQPKDASYNGVNTSQSSQQYFEQLQPQVAQMSQLMSSMLNNKTLCTTQEDYIAILAYSMLLYVEHNHVNTWIVDTGASNHMCCDRSIITNIHALPHPFHIDLPNGQVILVDYTGTVKINDALILDHVLLVSEFHFTLLSISKLTQDSSCKVVFTSTQRLFQN